jgi:hypothetical protein
MKWIKMPNRKNFKNRKKSKVNHQKKRYQVLFNYNLFRNNRVYPFLVKVKT